jgi:hypothetical protein
MALSVNVIDPKVSIPSSSTIFSSSATLSNVTVPYCSHYTSAANFSARPTADAFLRHVNFPTVYANIQSALDKTNTLIFSNVNFTPSDKLAKYLTTLDTQVLQLGYVSNCVTEKPDLTDKVFQANKELDLSKERYNDTHSPETHVSKYEGTFPIYRSLKPSTLFALFAAGIFLMLLAILIFMRMQGIELNFILPDKVTVPGVSALSALPGATDALTTTISSFFANNTMLIGFACIAGAFVGYLYFNYYKQWTS